MAKNNPTNEMYEKITEWLGIYHSTLDFRSKEKTKALIVTHMYPVVKNIARTIARRANDPVEDLIQAGFVGLLITGAFIIDANINRDVKYQNALYEKEMLEYRIDNMSENIVGNEMLYNDIVEFNNELRSTKKWANNPWTNWFHNPDIATIDYIEFNHL